MILGRCGGWPTAPLLLLFASLVAGQSAEDGQLAAEATLQAGRAPTDRPEDLIAFPLAALPRQPKSDSGYKIAPRPCHVSGVQGTCMFVWECLKTDGQHLGMCMDGFMFGSCCVHDIRDNDIHPSSSQTVGTAVTTAPPTTTTPLWTPAPPKWTPAPPQSTYSLHSKNPFIRPKRPPRPERPSIQRVGLLESSASSIISSRPEQPLVWPAPPPRTTPPRPQGKPPNWDKKEESYFPSSSSSSSSSSYSSSYFSNNDASPEDHFEAINEISTEPEEQFGHWASKSRPTRPPRPPKPTFSDGFELKTTGTDFIMATTASTTTTTTTATTTTSTTTTSTTTTTTTTTSTTTTTATTTELATFRPVVNTLPPLQSTSVSAGGVSARSTCGQPSIMLHCSEGRIVNGSRACYGQFPWQVSVRRTSFLNIFGSSTHRCGGALLNEYWVATAGHCVDDLTVSQIRLRLGEWDFTSESEPNKHLELKAVKKIVHPNYSFLTYENDIALVKTESRVRFADNIIPICLPGNDDLLIGEFGTVAGWGRLSERGVLPSILQHVSVPIVSNEKCKNMFLAAGRHEVIPDIFMCAGYEDGSKDSCQGDSGGPLVVKGKDGRWFLAGIISWGIGCAEPNLPGVCTRISKFRNWILQNVL